MKLIIHSWLKYILIVLVLAISIQDLLAVEVGRFLRIEFEIEEVDKVDFANNIEMTISKSGTGNNREIETLFFLNGFVVPDFGDAETVDVCFRYDGDDYCISEILVSSFDYNWTFGIDEEPFENSELQPYNDNTEIIYYIKYNRWVRQVDITD